MRLLDHILARPEFEAEPPVLVDVGASGAIHRDWARLAPRAVCIAFDPDPREMGYVEKRGAGYRKLIVYRAMLHDQPVESAEFHLTRSPYCSSTLRPRSDRLAAWAFRELFEVVETTRLPAVTLDRVLREQGLDRVDWFKTDSQGMDLRLFRSLGEARLARVLIAQFEPGILEAYEGEDTLADLLAFMRERGFWLSELGLRGTQRLSDRVRGELPPSSRAGRGLKISPGWGEATYLNAFDGTWSTRDLLLGWVIATLRRQHGIALEIALSGRDASADPVFDRLRRASRTAISRAGLAFPARALWRRLRALAGRRFGA